MAQVARPGAQYGPLSAQLAGMTAPQRRLAKAQWFQSGLASRLPFTFTLRGITVTVREVALAGSAVRFTVEAVRLGVFLTVDNPIVVVNPPIMVPNGQTFTDATGVVWSVVVEDVLGALEEVVTQVIEAQNP